MEDTNATQTAQFSIHDIVISDQSDEALQQMHDDIIADEVRFLDHVGIGPGIHFLGELVIEMRDREMEIHESLRHQFYPPRRAPGTTTGRIRSDRPNISNTLRHPPLQEIGTDMRGGVHSFSGDLPSHSPAPLNRKQRRAMKSKAKHG